MDSLGSKKSRIRGSQVDATDFSCLTKELYSACAARRRRRANEFHESLASNSRRHTVQILR